MENSRSEQILPELPFELTFDSVDSWLKRIPIRETQDACKLVFSALRRLNRYRMDPVQRIGFLERFNPFVFELSDALEALFVDATFPLQPNIRKLSKLSSHLHAELAVGYLYVLEHSDSDSSKITEQEKARMLVRALQSFYWSLIRVAQIYEAPSTRFWKRLYAVFCYAERHDLLWLEVLDREHNVAYSVEGLLKRITLFWLINPYRHRQHQIKQIVSLLDKFADFAEFRDQQPDEMAKSLFFVDLTLNVPPRHVSYSSLSTIGGCRFLNTHQFVDHVIKWAADPFSQRSRIEPAPDRNLLSNLVKTLKGTTGRKHQRKSENTGVRFIVGLSNIIETLSGPHGHRAPLNCDDARLSSSVPNYELLPMDGENVDLCQQFNIDGSQVTSEDIWGKNAEVAQDRSNRSSWATCRVANSSLQGYLITSTYSSGIKIRVGELIAISRDTEPLQLGVARWLEAIEESNVQFGIELLSRGANFAQAKFSVNSFFTERVLFLDRVPELDIPESIVFANAKHRSGTRVELDVAGKTKHFRLQKLIELSPDFVHCTLFVPQA